MTSHCAERSYRLYRPIFTFTLSCRFTLHAHTKFRLHRQKKKYSLASLRETHKCSTKLYDNFLQRISQKAALKYKNTASLRQLSGNSGLIDRSEHSGTQALRFTVVNFTFRVSTSNTEQATQYQQHSTSNTEPATQYQQYSTSNTVPTTQNQQHSTNNTVPAIQYQQHRTSNTVPTTQYQQHSTNNTVLATQYQQHSTTNTVPTTQYQ